jgi:hypothetical protein
MHSLITSRSVGIAGLLLVSAISACSDGGDEGLLITKNVAVLDIVGDCTFTGDPSEQFLAAGAVDPHSTYYQLNPQFESRITFDSTDPTQESQRTVIVNSGDIDIVFPDTSLFDAATLASMKANGLTHFKELFSAPVTPLGTSDASVQIIHEDLIKAVAAAAPGSDVEMEVTITAHGTMSGAEVDSQAFTYPVTETSVIEQPLLACPLPMGTTIDTGNPCNIFQDAPVTCCSNTDGSLQCPATLATM